SGNRNLPAQWPGLNARAAAAAGAPAASRAGGRLSGAPDAFPSSAEIWDSEPSRRWTSRATRVRNHAMPTDPPPRELRTDDITRFLARDAALDLLHAVASLRGKPGRWSEEEPGGYA